MTRLFFGLALDPEVAERLQRSVAASLEGCGPVAVYGAEDMHLTLAFLGEIEPEKIPSIKRAATEEFRGLTAPELRVGGELGAFPSAQAPRALFADVQEAPDSWGRLAALRNRALQVGLAHGWRQSRKDSERPFRPHVTVARPRGGASIPQELLGQHPERGWLPVDIVLFESRPTRGEVGEARYRALGAWPLVVRPG